MKEATYMGWARLDDSFHDHPKLIGLSLEALGLWVKCFTWAHRHHGRSGDLGFIPVDLPRTFAGNRASRLSSELVSKKLWDNFHGGEGWVIHDYVDYLPASERPATASKVSKSRSEAGSRGAAARWGKANEWQADSKLLSDVDSKPMPPTRPDPTHAKTDSSFELWWSEYPRKEGKAAAEKAYSKALKATTADNLLSGLRRYKLAKIGTEKAFIKMPAGWLNEGRWSDDVVLTSVRDAPRSAAQNLAPSVPQPPRQDLTVYCRSHEGYPVPCAACEREGGNGEF